tara:strand:- start:292 stop:660 length:369 start_codon:yes stop_codon:yes gene_type:complete
MPKPEANLNARSYAYLLFKDFLEVLDDRARSCINLDEDRAELLWSIVEDTVSDFAADVCGTKITLSEDGEMDMQSDVLSFLEAEEDVVPEETLNLTLSVIFERLSVLESKMESLNGKGNIKH